MSSAIGATCGLVAANYIWQLIAGHDWAVATERSFFQVVAIAIVLGIITLHSSAKIKG